MVHKIDFDGQATLSLYHSIGLLQNFQPRGQISIRSLKTGAVTVQQNPIMDTDALKRAANSDDFYQLKVISRSQEIEKSFLVSTKACLLYESQLSDIITIHVDLMGNIYGVSLVTAKNRCDGSVPTMSGNFNTSVLVNYMEHGPIPDVAMYVQRMEQEKVAKERGETKDNRSFFAKYWIYIIPLVLVFMMSGAGNSEQASR
nr:EOG090X0JXR [Cyclestheria hislopi]